MTDGAVVKYEYDHDAFVIWDFNAGTKSVERQKATIRRSDRVVRKLFGSIETLGKVHDRGKGVDYYIIPETGKRGDKR